MGAENSTREAQLFVETHVEGATGPSSVKTHHCLLPWPSRSEISSTLTHVVGVKMLWMKT